MDKLTPREPTPQMVSAAARLDRMSLEAIWRAMHDAAPTVEAEPVAFMWQHDETGRTGFCSRFDLENGFESNNPRLKIVGPLYTHPAAPQPLQGGMSNNELLSQWKKKLPCVKPSECELSAFAVGAEVGFARARDLERQDWDRVHHVLAKHGEHPGRTDDHLADVIDRALMRLKAAAPQPAALPELSETRGIRLLYEELVFAVGNKHHGETRHQTALRYIQQAEASSVSSAAKAALKGKQ